MLALAGLMTAVRAPAETIEVAAGDDLAAIVARATPGDRLVLGPGRHEGPINLARPLTIEGPREAILDGGGLGTTILVDAPDAVVRGLTVTGSGLSLETMDSGVRLTERAERAVVENVYLRDNLIGVHIEGAPDSIVRGNRIEGRRDLRLNERGNGVWVWNAPGATVEGNDIRFGRDGIFTTTSKRNTFENNTFRDVRFAVHYMYTNDSTVAGNVSIGNTLGYALMYSSRLRVTDNVSIGDREHGIMLNYANSSIIEDNLVTPDENGAAPEKCVFIYNSNKNDFARNRFEGCTIGVHFTAGSERNTITDNAFVGNETQVKYVGTRWLDWSAEGRGNYWSDNPAFDLDGDGVADAPYRPNDLVDQVLWRQPLAKLLLNSPALQVLRWTQSQFPALTPGGVVDTAPLMNPPEPGALARLAAVDARS
ncbi:MAG: nitrous oxide reductase family maturation protein NosD [Geminicoccaceae bacterium]|nr:nitrous oxide reductase family maturation protein NosD [Geminicoccaceae bacterium]